MSDEQEPSRRRWWSRHKLLIAVMVIVLAIVTARLLWGVYADRKLQAEIDAIAARGEPLAWADLAPAPVPDEQNAAELYKKAVNNPLLNADGDYGAAAKLPLEDLESVLNGCLEDADFRRRHKDEVREILRLSKESLALCRRARGLKASDWKMDFSGPAITVSLPPIQPLPRLRRLAKVLCLAALSAHDVGDDEAAAVEHLRDCLALARSAGTLPTLISHLVRLGIDGLSCAAIERMAHDLGTGGQGADMPIKQIHALIKDLLEDQDLCGQVVRAFIGERSMWYDTCERFREARMPLDSIEEVSGNDAASPLGHKLLVLTIGPMLKLDEARILRRMTGFVSAARAHTYPEFKRKSLPAYQPSPSRLSMFTLMLSDIMMPSFGRVGLSHFQTIASRRMSAVALAIRLYHVDHGRRPEKLSDLVPKYLPAVPSDPFSASGQSIRYLPGAKQPLLYCLGEDGRDDGGSWSLDDEGGVDDDESADLVFFLNGDRPIAREKEEEEDALPTQPTDDRE